MNAGKAFKRKTESTTSLEKAKTENGKAKAGKACKA